MKELKKHGKFQSIVDKGNNSISFDFQYGDIEDVTYDCDENMIYIEDDEVGGWNRKVKPDADSIASELIYFLHYT